ncbi:DUF5988 family protein [Actinomadura sp. 9N215]|uniref:DUF5988 family protein n=1 Tax=Actinomadura sp. 9N215 TaxID=3375150 RepID=UPI00378E7E0B
MSDNMTPVPPVSPVPDADTVEVVLEGNPDLPDVFRAGRSALAERRLKIAHRGGYEHFELVGEPGDRAPAVFRWTMRTRIAE